MAKGSYSIYSPVKNDVPRDKTTFWKSFLCSILILGVLAIIIFLIAFPFDSDFEKRQYESPHSDFLKTSQPKYEGPTTQSNINGRESTFRTQTNDAHSTFPSKINNEQKENFLINSYTNDMYFEVDNNVASKDVSTLYDSLAENTSDGNDLDNANSSFTNMLFEKCKNKEDDLYCDTHECKTISSRILPLMNYSEDPCKNYYIYACGGSNYYYNQESDDVNTVHQRIHNYLRSIRNFESKPYIKAFENYIKSCMSYEVIDGIRRVKKVFANFGYDFFEEKSNSSDIPQLEYLLLDLMKQDYGVLFDIKVNPESQNIEGAMSLSLQPIFYEDLMKDFIGDNKKYEEICVQELIKNNASYEINEDNFYTPYKTCIKSHFIADIKRALLLVDVFSTSKLRSDQIHKLLYDFDDLILKQMGSPEVAKRKTEYSDKNYYFITVSYITKEINEIDWYLIFNMLMGENIISNTTKVQVYHFDYLKTMLSSFTTTNDETARPDQKRKIYNSFLALYAYKLYKKFIIDQSKISDRTEYCHHLSNNLMNDVSSFLYLKSFDNMDLDKIDTYAKSTFYDITTSIKKNKNVPWNIYINNDLPEDIQLLTVHTNKPWINETDLLERFTEVNITDCDFIENTISLEIRKRTLMYSAFDKSPLSPNILWTLISSPLNTKLNHFWTMDHAYIVLPLAAIHNGRIFSKIPSYILMSDLGYKLAKETIDYSLTPNFHTMNVRNQFIKNVNINFLDQHSELSFQLNVNSSYISKDLMSSVYGAWHAYDAYFESKSQTALSNLTLIWQNITPDQVFLLHLAQQHCEREPIFETLVAPFESELSPPLITVNSIVLNNDNIREMLNCSVYGMKSAVNLTLDEDINDEITQVDG